MWPKPTLLVVGPPPPPPRPAPLLSWASLAIGGWDGGYLAVEWWRGLIQFPPEMDENWWRYGGELVTK